MNKQELILQLKAQKNGSRNTNNRQGFGSMKGIAVRLAEQLDESEITLNQAWEKIAEGYPQTTQKLQNAFEKVVDAVNAKTDMHIVNGKTTRTWPSKEPAKVPQWFYDWVTIRFGGMGKYPKVAQMYYELHNEEFGDEESYWIEHNTQTAINAILYGCEPIEPLYIMPVPYTEEEYYFEISLIGVPKPTKKWEAQKFTLEEIDKYFPKIAEFKEEVEG